MSRDPGLAASFPGPTGARALLLKSLRSGPLRRARNISGSSPEGVGMQGRHCATRFLLASLILAGSGLGCARNPSLSSPASNREDMAQVIVQIGGRYCEYHREHVERALRLSPAVRTVEFLNNHGTVLIHYQHEGVRPDHLAKSVEAALASGVGCKAWVDRGEQQPSRS